MPSIPDAILTINADDPSALTRLLDLPAWQVTRMDLAAGPQRLVLHCAIQLPGAACPTCQTWSAAPHDYATRTVRDLPWAGWASWLCFTTCRWFCAPCHRPFTPSVTALAPYGRTTRRYADLLVAQVRASSVQATAQQQQHGYKAVEGIYYRAAAATHPSGPPAGLIRRLGIDEIAARKGQGQYRLVLVDLDRGRVIEQLADRQKATLREYLLSWPAEQRAAVEDVATDFWAAYHEVVAEVLPTARVTGDRFHVQQHVNEALTTVRVVEQRKLGKEDREFVFQQRHVLGRNEEELDAADWVNLEVIKQGVPVLGRAHELKEELRRIYQTVPDRAGAAHAVGAWIAHALGSGIPALVAVGGFVERWREAILNYFVARTTSGMVEGLNNKIKLIKRQAFGFRNDRHFRLRVLMACDGAA